jgi:trehalose-phosphatase
MRRLFDDWESVLARAADSHFVLLLDFDGTLAPIAPTPDDAALPRETRSLLERLAENPRCTLAVVSGRGIEDLRGKVGIPGIVYVGNHGLEADGTEALPSYEPSRLTRELLTWMHRELAARLAEVPGVFFEDKNASLAVHYRLVAPRDAARVETDVRRAVEALDVGGFLEIAAGKMVLDLRPRLDWNKGTAVAHLVRAEERLRAGAVFPIYVGDDATDEDAFRALEGRGIAVLVGEPRKSHATHYVKDTEEVARMLRALAERCGEPLNR